MNVGIIGCGKMAQALAAGLCACEPAPFSQLLVNDVDESRTTLFASEFGAQSAQQQDLVSRSDVVILSVKPDQVADVLNSTFQSWHTGQIIISIAAGLTIDYLQKRLPPGVMVVRAMPNLPALIGDGIAAISTGAGLQDEDICKVEVLLQGMGSLLRIDESKMDAVTAVSGSGPAYIMLVAEAMIEAAVHIGLDWQSARKLVIATMLGSTRMLEITGQHPAQLKNQVSSPGGTTIAGLRQLEEMGLRTAFFNAIESAYLRAIKLGQE